LEDSRIVAQFTILGNLQQNGVAERCNRTLTDRMSSMISRANSLGFLWGETFKTALYIINCVPIKVVPSTPFKLWIRCKPSLNHLKVWGCPTEVKLYNSTLSLIPKQLGVTSYLT